MPKQPSVLVLYNEPVLPNNHPDSEAERDILDTLGEVVRVLQVTGFVVRKLGINLDPRPLISEVKRRRPAAVFNLFEGVPTRPGSEVAVAALLEWLDVPFTGCPSFALAMGRDKIRSKYMMAAAGVPTAKFEVIESEPVPDWTSSWPVIVKPAYEDASVGIDQASVATDQAQLAARVRYVFERFGPPVLVEEFVDGREFHVNVIEEGEKDQRVAKMLPLAEIAFKRDAPDLWPVYTYTAKWDENSAEYNECPLIAPIELPPEPTARVREHAIQAFRLFHCRDFARIDVRMTPSGEFRVLEMNPNPYLISLALVKGLEATGRTHEQLVVGMALAAMARGKSRVKTSGIKISLGVSS